MFYASYHPDTGKVFQKGIVPDTHAIERSETGEVLSVTVNTQLPPAFANTQNIEITEAQYYAFTPFKVLNGEIVQDLAGLKTLKNTDINRCRREADANGFIYAGKLIAADPASQNDVYGVDAIVQRTGAFPSWWVGGWKASDNSVVVISTVSEWNDFVDAMTTQGGENYIHSQQLKAALNEAETADEVAAIAW